MSSPINTQRSEPIPVHSAGTERKKCGDFETLCLFAFEYPPVSGGIARLCAGIGDLLKQKQKTTNVLTQKCDELTSSLSLPEIRVSPRRPVREWRAYRWLRRQLSNTSAFAAICGIWYPEGLIAWLAGVRPFVILAHGAELLPPQQVWRRPLWNLLRRHVLESASLVIANSEYTADLVASVALRANIKAIPLAVDWQWFSPGDREAARTKLDVGSKRVLCTVSRIQKYKAHDTVLRAIAGLSLDKREQLLYLIAGTGPQEAALRKLATSLGVESQVRWLGFVSEKELPDVYRASDLFVLCTRHAPKEQSVEGFGLVFLEAQSCGTPVVGTRTGGIADAVREGDGGWLIEPDDCSALAAILVKLIDSPETFREAGIKARERVLRENTWQVYGQRFSTALKSVGIGDCKTVESAATKVEAQGVSVVVPTLNRGSFLIDTVNDLLAQDHRPLEILIVDQSKSVDPALQRLVREHPDLLSYRNVEFCGLPSARNYGWQQAKHEAIVFVDDDIRCGPFLVSEHLRTLSRRQVGMVAGGIDEGASPLSQGSSLGRFNSWSATPVRNFSGTGECIVQHVAGCNFSAWRSALRAAGGFDEALTVGAALYEETELCLRVRKRGLDIYFNGAARVQHLAAGKGGCRVSDLPTYMASLAHNRAILIRRHLRWFQTPVAYLRLFLLFISYAVHYHTTNIFGPGLAGLRGGARAANRSPICGDYKAGVKA